MSVSTFPAAGASFQKPGSPRLLRYRTDCSAQLRQHLHPLDGHGAALFFPDPDKALTAGARVILEIFVGSLQQRCLLYGAARLRDQSVHEGVWLELPGARTTVGWAAGTAVPMRCGERFASDRIVRVDRAGKTASAALLADVSGSGARLIGAGALAAEGEEVSLTLLGARPLEASNLGRARVRWSQGREAGVQFLANGPRPGPAVAKLIEELRAAWSGSLTVEHPVACRCLHGAPPRDPAVPRSLFREAASAAGGEQQGR